MWAHRGGRWHGARSQTASERGRAQVKADKERSTGLGVGTGNCEQPLLGGYWGGAGVR